MIQLTDRQRVLKECPALAKYMQDWQLAEYKELQEELNVEELEAFKAEMDEIDTSGYTKHLIRESIYNLNAENIYDYIQKIADSLFKITEAMGWKQLSFLVLYKRSWLYQKNDYPPVKTELKYLTSIGATDNTVDAITATGTELIRILKSIFWLSRCNASLPYIHFSAPGSDLVLSLCKYGLLHIYSYDKDEYNKFEALANEYDLNRQEQCHDFLEGGAIIGRQLYRPI